MHTNLGIGKSNRNGSKLWFQEAEFAVHMYICVILGPYLCTNVVQSNLDMHICIGRKGLFANLELMMHIHDSPLSLFLKKERRESLKQLP